MPTASKPERAPSRPADPEPSGRGLVRTIRALARVPAVVWLGIGIAIVVGTSIASIVENNARIDGTRYFWLDDDQMIAMRYARNLAEGEGLVWNPGERVEGYTNFLWTLVMAALHLIPVGDAHTSLVVRVVNAALACAVLFACARLVRRFLPEPGLALPAVLIPVALSHELLFWSMHGFETTLLTLVYLVTLDRILQQDDPGPATFVLMGAIPLVRSDAHHLWLGAALVAIGLARDRGRVLGRLALAAALPAAHLGFRWLYYGQWLPNTYYLKVDGLAVPDRLALGASYLAYFAAFYWLLLGLAVLGALVAREPRRRALPLGAIAVSLAYTLWVGGDNFFGARFLAPQAPLIVILAASGARDLAERSETAEAALLSAGAGSYLAFAGFLALMGSNYSLISNPNGGVEASLVTAVAIRNNSAPDARVAVHAAGIVPYFSRRPAIDMLGKTDPHVAHLAPRNTMVGHNKFDPDHSLGAQHADLAVMLWLPAGLGDCSDASRATAAEIAPPWVAAIYLSQTFQREFCGAPIELPGAVPVYVRRQSAERAGAGAWAAPWMR
jgi:hypothetical protein